jgi:O-antigen ligase
MSPATRRTALAASVVAIGTAIYTTGPLYRVRTWWSFEDPLAADWFVIAVQVVVGALALAALVRFGRWRRLDRTTVIVAGVLVAWLALGALWSASPSTTLRESLLIGVALLAGAGAAAVAGERLLVVSAWIGVHLGLGWSAVLIVLVRPGTQFRGQWTGVYFNPNSLALVSAFGILLAIVLLAMIATRRIELASPWRVGAMLVVAASVPADLWLISGTGALTPLFGLALAVGIAAVAVVAQRSVGAAGTRPLDARFVVGVAGVALVALGALTWVTRSWWSSAVGRTGGFSRRTDMWEVALDWFARAPIAGQGYLGAWSDPEFTADMLAARDTVLGSTHNSFVELLLGAGIVGFALVIALYARLWLAAGVRALADRRITSVWPLAVLVFVIVEHLAETLFVGGQLMVATTGALIVVSASTSRPPATPDPSPVTGEAVGVEGRS